MSRQMVLVEWADAYAHEGSWIYISDLVDKGEYPVVSIGWLLETGDGGQTGHVTLAQSIGHDDAADHIINIPVGMVRRIAVLDDQPVKLADFIRARSKKKSTNGGTTPD